MTSEISTNEVVMKTDFCQWNLVAFFSRKIIFIETWYETHDGKLLVIVKTFKTWRYYLEGCKHAVLVLINHNNLRYFIDIKSLSSRQFCWAQKLSQFHFQIDYCQGKANVTGDTLSRFPQKSQDIKDEV